MNYYERVQRSIDFIESRLEEDIDLNDAAREAFKKLEPMRAAYYRYFGRDPEVNAISVLTDWMRRSGAFYSSSSVECTAFRTFGYDSPAQTESEDEYGYEVCVTIDDKLQVNDDKKGMPCEGCAFFMCYWRQRSVFSL